MARQMKRFLAMTLAASMVMSVLSVASLAAEEETPVLICTQEEHEHGEACYGEAPLTCTEEESEGHAHDEDCYTVTEEKTLTCEDESEEHVHDEDCYTVTENKELTCGQDESEGHAHGTDCHGEAPLTCEKPEHAHEEGCYEAPKQEEEQEEQPEEESDEELQDNGIMLLAEGDEVLEVDGFTATFDEATGTLTINGEGELTREIVDSFEFSMPDPDHNNEVVRWALNGYSAFSQYKQPRHLNDKVKALVIGEGITSIEEKTFGGDTNPNASISSDKRAHDRMMGHVERIVLPEGLTEIGASAFDRIGKASGTELEINFPSTLEEIGSKAFYSCKTLPAEFTLSIPGLVIGSEAFGECEFTSITVDGATEIGANAFCHAYIENIYTGEVTGGGNVESVTLKNIGAVGSLFEGQLRLKNLTITNVDTIEKLAFWNTTSLETVTLTNVKNIGEQAFYGYSSDGKYMNLKTLTIDGCENIEKQAFVYCKGLTDVTLKNVDMIGAQAFQQAFNQNAELTLDNIGTIGERAFYYSYMSAIKMGKVDTITIYAFDHSSYLTTIDSLANVGRIDGFAFYGCEKLSGLTVEDLTKMGFNGNYGDVMERVQAILSGKFKLDSAPGIVDITENIPEAGWEDGKVGKSDNWNTHDNGTQLVEQARWTNANKTEAEVKVDAYYTAPKQMDYIFVADLSASMAQLGNDKDMNSRFYDMQSKLLDMTGQIMGSEGYDCRMAIVTFGGLYSGNQTKTVMDFTANATDAKTHIANLEPLYESTDYGLGMQEALKLVQGNTDRNTVVVFLSDGAPNVNGSGDQNGTVAAAAIKALNVPIYGVLHSAPAAQHDNALAKMQAVCGDNTVYESTDTESFGKAMNDAFTAVYPDYTVTIPVNKNFEKVRDLSLSVTGGEAEYDEESHTITWTITGMPFTKHTLTYKMSLTAENAGKYGDQSYDVNEGNAVITDGAQVETPVLTRTVSRPSSGGGDDGPSTYPLTIYYVYEDGSRAAATVNRRLARGAEYSVTSPAIEGYTADIAVVEGTMPASAVTVTVTYTAAARPVETPTPTESGTPTPTVTPGEEDVTNEDVPLTELPPEEVADENVPLTGVPQETVADEDVPLADVPETGDVTILWLAIAAASGCGLGWIKRKEDEEA